MKKLLVILFITGIGVLIWFFSGENKGTENCNLIEKGDNLERVTELLGEPYEKNGEVFSYSTQPLESMNSTIVFDDLNRVISKNCVDGEDF